MPKEESSPYLLYNSNSNSSLEKLGERIHLPKKHVIIEQGEFTRYCYLVKSGRVISYEEYPNGEERIFHFYEINTIFLEANVLFHKSVTIAYRTAEACELIRIDKKTLLKALKDDYQLALDLIASTESKYEASLTQIRHMSNKNALWKICNLLLGIAEYCGIDDGNKIIFREKISQQTISSMLGLNRITVVRAIKKLENAGYLKQIGGYYCIYDIDGLLEVQENE